MVTGKPLWIKCLTNQKVQFVNPCNCGQPNNQFRTNYFRWSEDNFVVVAAVALCCSCCCCCCCCCHPNKWNVFIMYLLLFSCHHSVTLKNASLWYQRSRGKWVWSNEFRLYFKSVNDEEIFEIEIFYDRQI